MARIRSVVLLIVLCFNFTVPVTARPLRHDSSSPSLAEQPVQDPTLTADAPTQTVDPMTPILSPTATPTSGLTETNTPTSEPAPSATLIPTETLAVGPTPTDTPTPDLTSIEEKISPEISLSLLATPQVVIPGKSLKLNWHIEGLDVLDLPAEWLLAITVPPSFFPADPELGDFDPTVLTLQLPVGDVQGTIKWQVAEEATGPFPIEARLLDENRVEVAQAALLLEPPPGLTRIETGGGEAVGLNGRLRVKVPPGAVRQAIGLSIQSLATSRPCAVRLTANDWASAESLHRFDEPIELEWTYDPADFDGDASALTWFSYDEERENWIALPTAVDLQTQTVRGWTDHFSDFAIDLQDWQAAKIAPLSSAEVSQFTGAATYSIPIRVPQGPGGIAPAISLDYNSQLVDNATNKTQASWVGMGWTLSAGGSIQRNMRGDVALDHDDTFSMVIGNQSFSLVPVSYVGVDSRHAYMDYKTSDNNFWKIRRYRNDEQMGGLESEDYWVIWDQTGTRFTFDKRAYYFAFKSSYYGAGSHFRAFPEWGWFLTSIQYPSGQTLRFYYDFHRAPKGFYYQLENGGWAEAAVIDLSVYLTDIVYPDGHTRIHFGRDAGRTDYDPEWFTNYANHNLGDRDRLSNIQVLYDPAITYATNEYWEGSTHITLRDNVTVQSAGDETILWEYRLGYTSSGQLPQVMPGIEWPAPEGSSTKGRTLTLMSVREYGIGSQASLPAITFNYSVDHLHLDRVDNGQGGKVEFSYEKWRASEASPKATIGRQWSDGSYPYVNNYDRIHTITSMDSFRPGTEYRFSCRTNSGREAMQYWLNYGPREEWKTITSPDGHWTEAFFTIPYDAYKVVAYIRISPPYPGTSLSECSTRYFITRYRVTEKRVFDGINGNPSIYTYDYTGAAVNTTGNSAVLAEATSLPKFTVPNSEFRGHSLVKVTDPKGLQTWTYFHQDDARMGRAYQIDQYDVSAQLLSRTEITYDDASAHAELFRDSNYCARRWISDGVYHCYADPRVYWNYVTAEQIRLYTAGNVYSGTRKEYNYQTSHQGGTQYGNLTHLVESYWNGSTWQDQRLLVWRFYPNHTDSTTTSQVRYLVGLPGYHNQYRCSATANGNCFNPGMSDPSTSALLSSAWSLYDNSTTYSTSPTTGILTGERKLLDFADPVGFTGARYQDVRYGYDSWGNLVSISRYTQPGDSANLWQGTAQTTSATYDATFHTRLLWQRNALGHQTNLTYSGNGHWCGQPSSVTGPNGSATTVTYSYDAFCRLTTEIHPGDSSAYPTIQYAYTDTYSQNALVMAQKVQRIIPGSNAQLYTERYFYDGLGRVIQSQVGNAQVESGTKDLVVDYQYNADGQVTKQTLPYEVTPWSGTGSAYRPQNLNPPVVVTMYDTLGRPTLITKPDGATRETAYAYNGLQTTITDAKGNSTTQLSDAWGRVVEVRPPEGPWMKYVYDALDQLTQAETYGQGGSTLFTTTAIQYDSGGRKTGMSDPDMGAWAYAYDALGNLTRQTDAKNQTTCLYYDALNRLTGKDYRTDTSCAATDPGLGVDEVVYRYDETGAVTLENGQFFSFTHTIGKRTSVHSNAGDRYYRYEPRGQVAEEAHELVYDPVYDLGIYRIGYGYNSAGLLIDLTYPDGEVVHTDYYNQLLAAVLSSSTGNYYAGSATGQVVYDELGRLKTVPLGGSLTKSFMYYPATNATQGTRLNTMQVGPHLNLTYTYDANGNILSIADQVGGGTQNLAFGYDLVNRLTSATASAGTSLPAYNFSYTFNPGTGLMQNKTEDGSQSAYSYSASHPHAVSSLGASTYSYDANGNMVTRTEEGITYTQTWTEENKLKRVTWVENGLPHSALFVYDGDGNRLLEINLIPLFQGGNREITTVFIGGIYEKQIETTGQNLSQVFGQ